MTGKTYENLKRIKTRFNFFAPDTNFYKSIFKTLCTHESTCDLLELLNIYDNQNMVQNISLTQIIKFE